MSFYDKIDLSHIDQEDRFVVIGAHTGLVYVSAPTKPMVFQRMQTRFPSFVKNEHKTPIGGRNKRSVTQIYPEPMLVRSVDEIRS